MRNYKFDDDQKTNENRSILVLEDDGEISFWDSIRTNK